MVLAMVIQYDKKRYPTSNARQSDDKIDAPIRFLIDVKDEWGDGKNWVVNLPTECVTARKVCREGNDGLIDLNGSSPRMEMCRNKSEWLCRGHPPPPVSQQIERVGVASKLQFCLGRKAAILRHFTLHRSKG